MISEVSASGPGARETVWDTGVTVSDTGDMVSGAGSVSGANGGKIHPSIVRVTTTNGMVALAAENLIRVGWPARSRGEAGSLGENPSRVRSTPAAPTENALGSDPASHRSVMPTAPRA